MQIVTTHKDLAAVGRLSFCYLCGRPFEPSDETDRDHVPPKACFALVDRARPLILRSHVLCNSGRKVSDERIGQFISLKHRRFKKENQRIKITHFRDPVTGREYGGLTNVDIRGEIERWIRAFHAALYREPLERETQFAIETPFQIAIPGADGRPIADRFRERQHKMIVGAVKANRFAVNVDRVACNNGKLIYECVWKQATNGKWVCLFGLDLYAWKDLGDINNFQSRGCAGLYLRTDGRLPPSAATDANPLIETPNLDELDPFGR